MISLIWTASKVSLLLLVACLIFASLLNEDQARWVKTRALPITIGFWVLGMFSPSIWLVYAAIVLVIPLASRTRAEVPAVYLIVMLSLPSLGREFGALGVYMLLLDKFLFGAIGLGIAALVRPRRGPSVHGWFDIPFWLVMILEILLARGQNATGILRVELNVLLAYILPYYVISRSMTRPEHVRSLLLAFVYGGFVLSVIGLYEARTSWLVYETINQHLGDSSGPSSYTHIRSGRLRASGSFFEATSFGLFLATAFLATLAIPSLFKSNRAWLVGIAGLLGGLYAANARASMMAAAIGFLSFDIYRRRYMQAGVKAGAVAILYMTALLVAQFSDKVAERIGVAGGSTDTVDYRKRLATRGWEEIQKHPFTGIDLTSTYAALSDLRQGEGIVDFVNAYIFYGMTAGIGGIIALLLCFTLTMGHLIKRRRALTADPSMIRAGAFAFSVSVFTILTTYTSGFGGRAGVIFYVVLATASSLGVLRLRKSERNMPAIRAKTFEEPLPA